MSQPPARSAASAGRSISERAAEKLVSEVVVLFHGAARAVRLYPAENAAVRKVVGELAGACDRVKAVDREFALKRGGDYLFINDTRLRLGFDNFTAVSAVLALLRDAGVGSITLRTRPEHRDWVALMGVLNAPADAGEPGTRWSRLAQKLDDAGVDAFGLGPVNEGLAEVESEVDGRERSRQTYLKTLTVTREVFQSARMGGSTGLKKARQALRGVVDQILKDEASIVGLTTLRDFDEYTFVHSVNVCILAVALGRRLGLSKAQLLDLGLAAVMHDVGKSRVPIDILNKRGKLTDEEFEEVRQHTWKGVLALFNMPFGAVRPWRAMTVAYEHHLRVDLAGYPRVRRARELSLFSRIVAVADGFDAATSKRVYQDVPWSPADVLRGMADSARFGLDPVIVKAFINLVGTYPVGTVVVMDTGEVGVVSVANPDPAASGRPQVRLVVAADGSRVQDEVTVDLAERAPEGRFLRTIVRTEDPDRYGITVSDYTI